MSLVETPEKLVFEKGENGKKIFARFPDFLAEHVITGKAMGNMSYSHGEDAKVFANRGKVYERMGLDRTNAYHMWAQHGREMRIVEKKKGGIEKCDALFTETPGIALQVALADCYAVIIFDPRREELGLIHLSRKNVQSDLTERMVATFSGNKQDLQVAVAPGIDTCCYKFNIIEAVRESVRTFWKSRGQLEDLLLSSLKSQFSWTVTVDLRQRIVEVLTEIGIPEERIYTSKICTSCDFYFDGKEHRKMYFFSHNRVKKTGEEEGRNLVLAIN